MDAETSQRFGYSFRGSDLTPEQEQYVMEAAEEAASFDELPADVLHVIYGMEAKYGVSPIWRDKVENQQRQIDSELDG